MDAMCCLKTLKTRLKNEAGETIGVGLASVAILVRQYEAEKELTPGQFWVFEKQ